MIYIRLQINKKTITNTTENNNMNIHNSKQQTLIFLHIVIWSGIRVLRSMQKPVTSYTFNNR